MRNWMLSGCAVLLASVLTACPPTATKPVITAFTASPTTITNSGTDVITLAWTVTGATDVALSSDNADAVITLGTGSPPITATAKGMKKDTTFTVTAKNATGNSTQDAKVTLAAGSGATIASSVPADAAKGVAINSTIVVTFSAAMDTAATVSAFTSSTVPTTPTSFVWSNSNKTLTITPSALLNTPVAAPATGTNKPVSYSFAATAKDATGAALTSTAARTFETQKAIKATIAGTATLSGNVITTTGTGIFPTCATPCPQNNYDSAIQAGDSNGFAGSPSKIADPNFSYKGFAGFEISSIPASATLVSATVSLTQANFTGVPYTIIAGGLKLQSITDPSLAAKDPDANRFDFYNATATKEFVLATDDTAGVKSVVVTTAVAADLAGRATFANRSLFRLIFPTVALGSIGATKVDALEDIARFNTPTLEVVYSQP
jgi:hypothetical protein